MLSAPRSAVDVGALSSSSGGEDFGDELQALETQFTDIDLADAVLDDEDSADLIEEIAQPAPKAKVVPKKAPKKGKAAIEQAPIPVRKSKRGAKEPEPVPQKQDSGRPTKRSVKTKASDNMEAEPGPIPARRTRATAKK